MDIKGLTEKRVLIDPGHGGVASGAVAGGVLEKDINLAIAMFLSESLSRRGISVSMTRTADVSLSLEARQELIKQFQPAVFVSVHCNSIEDDPATPQDERMAVHGFEIFFRNRALSLPLARCIAAYLSHSGIKNRGELQDVEYLGKRLAVLNVEGVPSVLIEFGYISNPEEREKIIHNEAGLAELAAYGIDQFLAGGGR